MTARAEAELGLLEAIAEDPRAAYTAQATMDAYDREHGALYGDDPVPTSIKPNLISGRQEALLARASQALWGALETFVERFLETPELQDAWGLSEQELALYKVDPGYPDAIQISRFDGFLDGDQLAFLEFNCDSPGGAGYADVIHEAFLEAAREHPPLAGRIPLDQPSRVGALHQALTDCYAAWRKGRDRSGDPYIVLADWPDVGSRPDIDITVERLTKRGADVAFADPRKLSLDGDQLVHGDRRVDLVYKRVITKELLSEPSAKALLEAYRAGTVCMVNAPRSVIVGDKRIMAELREDATLKRLTDEQREAVERFVPWTHLLRDEPVHFDGQRVELRDLLLERREEFVLKPTRGYGGEDVHLGGDTDPETWGALVDENLGEDWIAQRFAEIPRGLVPRIDEDGVRFELVNVNVNPFVFGGRYAGAYTRISTANVINVSHGGGLVPTITVE